MTMKPWPKIQQRPATVQREFRGTDKRDAFSIGNAFASDMKNLTSSSYPALTVRPGYTALGSGLTNVTGLGVWKDTELHAIDNGDWKKYSGGAWGSSLASGLGSNPASFCNFQGGLAAMNLIMANGSTFKRYDGATVSSLLNAPAAGNYVTAYQNRVWASVGNELHASSLDNAEEWAVFTDDSKSYVKDMESDRGETINALSGGLTKLVVGFPNAIHELYGGVPSDFLTKLIVDGVGPVNNRCLLGVKGTMFILHYTGLYQYSGGTLPSKEFSAAIQSYIDDINTAALSVCSIGSDGENVYISIPTGSSATPNTIIVYSLTYKTWYVWEDFSPKYFAVMSNQLYMAETARVLSLGGATDAGSAIAWEWVSKPFTAPSMSQVIRWLRMWVTTTLPTGSTLAVTLSKDGSAWESVGSITASSDIQHQPIYVASSKVQNAKQIYFKLTGSGSATIHEVAYEQDALPLR